VGAPEVEDKTAGGEGVVLGLSLQNSPDVDFPLKIKLVRYVGECRGGPVLCRKSGIPPSPPIHWNHRISAKMATDLWGSVGCGQNLDVKDLRGRFVGTTWLVPTVTASTMIAQVMGWGQGWMSQAACGNSPKDHFSQTRREVGIRHLLQKIAINPWANEGDAI
jgi:hypothetical protein